MKCCAILNALARDEDEKSKESLERKKKRESTSKHTPGEGEPWQDAAHGCLDALMGTIKRLTEPGLEVFRNITRNHLENTRLVKRHGAPTEWLDPESTTNND